MPLMPRFCRQQNIRKNNRFFISVNCAFVCWQKRAADIIGFFLLSSSGSCERLAMAGGVGSQSLAGGEGSEKSPGMARRAENPSVSSACDSLHCTGELPVVSSRACWMFLAYPPENGQGGRVPCPRTPPREQRLRRDSRAPIRARDDGPQAVRPASSFFAAVKIQTLETEDF